MTFWIILVTVLLILAIVLFFRAPDPEPAPLLVDENDPRMLEASRIAQHNVAEFLQLFAQNPTRARVKIPFRTSTGHLEFLWGEVLSIREEKVELLLFTYPVAHKGNVSRKQTCPLNEIADWAVSMENGKVKGGYTMRTMFRLARERWGELPDKLKQEELNYE